MKYNILLCEDDVNLGNVLKSYLELNNYIVTLCRNGVEGLEEFKKAKYNLIIMDIMMPEMDGFQTAEKIRDFDVESTFIFLSAKEMKEDVIRGYNLGADDYITKPFDSDILLRKIKIILKRKYEGMTPYKVLPRSNVKYTFGDFVFLPMNRELFYKTNRILLSPKESGVLELFCQHPNQVIYREKILLDVWKSTSHFDSRSLDVYVVKVRKLLQNNPNISIKGLHKLGYEFMIKEPLHCE
ncbi:MAG: response regulator transcription factor [Chitinophagaceae bacterium]